MATYTKFNQFTKDLVDGVHNFNTGQVFKVMLTNVAPVATNSIKGDLTEITPATGYAAGGTATTITTATTTGTAKITGTDVVFTAGATVGPFRYAVLYNDTASTPVKPLIAFWDYGSSISLLTGETFTVDFDGSAGIFTLA